MKTPTSILVDVVSVLDPGLDQTQIMLELLRDNSGTLHLRRSEDALQPILYRLISGEQICEYTGEGIELALSEIIVGVLCEACTSYPGAIFHALADPELGHASRVVFDLQLVSIENVLQDCEKKLSTLESEEALLLGWAVTTHFTFQHLRSEDIELPSNDNYAAIIEKMIAASLRSYESFYENLKTDALTGSIKAYLHGKGVEQAGSGDVVVVLGGIKGAVLDMQRNEERRSDTTASKADMNEFAQGERLLQQALTLQHAYAPQTALHAAVVTIPRWVAFALQAFAPNQVRTDLFDDLTVPEADTAKRLYTFDPTSVYSDLGACVTAALALNI